MGDSKTFSFGRRKMELVLAACLATVLAPPGTASAEKRPPRPGGVSAVDAYRESVRTSSGAKPVGYG